MFSKKKIMVVEDNEPNRKILCHILAASYDTVEAENGKVALDLLEQYGEEISLILLDIIMPVMDGNTFLSIVKSDAHYSAIPVIVTTQSDSESDEVSALSNGAADFVAKPYKPQIILHRVASIINLRETAAMMNLFQYDQLTGIYSKEFFYQKAREIMEQNPDRQYDIICSDIENFKLVNDVFGTQRGDELLKHIAMLYAKKVEGLGICARLNSDHFVSLIERRYDYTEAMFLDANSSVNSYASISNLRLRWGIYQVNDPMISIEQMCDRAILASESIKGQYGKYFTYYDETLRQKLLFEQAITDTMETALAEGQFQIYLQPKYRISDERLSGAEALVRWIDPVRGFQAPGDFIPLFEKNGFITKLDQYVWDKTCAIIKDWDDRGLPAIPVSVNVSRADIYNDNLPVNLKNIVTKYGLDFSRLHLEITESAYTEDPAQIIDTVSALREIGFVVEMDDFGSGYSSLNMLNELPIDVLKLDMKFIHNETAKPKSHGILQFIISLAQWMDLSIIAEGVETKEQVDKLREIGCDYVQGFYFARPMPYKEFEALLVRSETENDPEVNAAIERGEEQTALFVSKDRIVLLADDDAAYRAALREPLKECFRVFEAVTSNTVVDVMQKRAGEIAAVILSLNIMGRNGLELLRQFKSDPMLSAVPIIVTSPPDPELERAALELGADDFVVKPYLPESMMARLQRTVRNAWFVERERVLREAAYHDYLTGLLNRRGLEVSVEALGGGDRSVAVCLFDIDDLKHCNDSCGHANGDELLSRFGATLKSQLRSGDILARLGGDEFVAVMKNMPSSGSALERVQNICRVVRNSVSAGMDHQASCSVGITMMEPDCSFSEAIARADQALYRAKQEQKGSCCLWEGNQNE